MHNGPSPADQVIGMYVVDQGGAAGVHCWRVFWILAFLYFFLILLPVLMADRHLNDDLIRAVEGNFGWNHNGRPLATLAMRVLELGSQRLIDISPLTQLLAIAVLAWAGVLISRRFGLRSPWVAALAALPLGAQPFFLENISYRFDSVCMALAVFFAILPVLARRRGWFGWSSGGASALACLCLYQPAITAFLIFALLEISHLLVRKRAPIRLVATTALKRLSQLLLALVLYKLMFEPSIEGWVRDHGQIAPFTQWPEVIVDNARRFAVFVGSAFSARWLSVYSLLLLITFIVPIVALTSRSRSVAPGAHEDAGRGRIVFESVLWLVALPCVAGPMLLLADPVLMPRVLIGVGALLAALLIRSQMILEQHGRTSTWTLALSAVWALAMAVPAAAYGNAANAQQRYEHAVASRLVDDLAELAGSQPLRGYALRGSVGLAPVAAHVQRHFPLVGWLVLPYLRADDYHSRSFLKHFFGQDAGHPVEVALPDGVDSIACSGPPERIRRAYRIHLVDRVAVVHFRAATDSPNECLD